MKNLLHLILFTLLISGVNAQDLLRGPYQQSGTPNSVKVMWRTSTATTGWVKIGDSPNNLDKTFTESSALVDHNVLVSGLTPYTKYYYAIGYDDVTLSSGDDHYITTNKSYGDTTGLSFWAIGDFGKANEPQKLARNAFMEFSKTHPVDFMLMLGDNAYQNGFDYEYQDKVFSKEYGYDSIMRYLHYYPTPGNHDYNSIRGDNILNWVVPDLDTGAYYEIHDIPKNGEAGGFPSGTEIYYSFDYGHVHFIVLNSETFAWTSNKPSPMKTWLAKDLEANKLPWTVCFFHQPPFTAGSHSSDTGYEVMMANMKKFMIPILEAAGVDLVLSGHSHVYERSYLINGFYEKAWAFDPAKHIVDGSSGNPDLGEAYVKGTDGKGTVYSVIGNSGNYTSDDDIPQTMYPTFFIRDGGTGVTGSIVVDVVGGQMTVQYINRFGDILDKYSIVKTIEAVPTGVKDNYSDIYEMSAFPNPSSDKLSIQFNNPSMAKTNLIVTDLSGKQVLAQEVTGFGQSTVQVAGWKQLAAGSYIVSIDVEGRAGSINVVKAK
ncbi:MAG: metallophosphoesterase [Chitinophagales bacterium]|nr:metallophosphoesterase [Chitinophagales bacterium]MCZ2393728.1 metallophosphoesterase [Chitinophagales bacterium]